MAKITIKNDGASVEVPDGTVLGELDGKCSVLYACKMGTCGSCLVRVVEGMENLEPPNEIEALGLQNFGTQPNHRLLCQAKIKSGEIVIEY